MAPEKLPMLPWFPRDFMSSTRGWRLAERGLYRELLDAQWELGFLPKNLNDLAAIVGARRAEFAAAWARVKVKFVDDGNGGLINLKLEEHRADALRRAREYSAAGRKGGLASAASRKQATLNDRSSNRQATLNTPSPSPSEESESEVLTDSSVVLPSVVGTRKNSRAADRGTRIADDFVLTAGMRQWATEHTPNVDLQRGTEEFIDYWRAVPGARGRKLNWEITWRNRMRELDARASTRTRSNAPSETKFERMARALDHDE